MAEIPYILMQFVTGELSRDFWVVAVLTSYQLDLKDYKFSHSKAKSSSSSSSAIVNKLCFCFLKQIVMALGHEDKLQPDPPK